MVNNSSRKVLHFFNTFRTQNLRLYWKSMVFNWAFISKNVKWMPTQPNSHFPSSRFFFNAIKLFLRHQKKWTFGDFKNYLLRKEIPFYILFCPLWQTRKKTHKKGLMQKVQKVQEDWLANVSQKNRFLKYGQIVTFRRRVPETKKHIIYFNWHL